MSSLPLTIGFICLTLEFPGLTWPSHGLTLGLKRLTIGLICLTGACSGLTGPVQALHLYILDLHVAEKVLQQGIYLLLA